MILKVDYCFYVLISHHVCLYISMRRMYEDCRQKEIFSYFIFHYGFMSFDKKRWSNENDEKKKWIIRATPPSNQHSDNVFPLDLFFSTSTIDCFSFYQYSIYSIHIYEYGSYIYSRKKYEKNRTWIFIFSNSNFIKETPCTGDNQTELWVNWSENWTTSGIKQSEKRLYLTYIDKLSNKNWFFIFSLRVTPHHVYVIHTPTDYISLQCHILATPPSSRKESMRIHFHGER